MKTIGPEPMMNYRQRGRRHPLSPSLAVLTESRLNKIMKRARRNMDKPGYETLWKLAYQKRAELISEMGGSATFMPQPPPEGGQKPSAR